MRDEFEKWRRETEVKGPQRDWLAYQAGRQAGALAMRERAAKAVTNYSLSLPFDEDDRSMICAAADAIRALSVEE